MARIDFAKMRGFLKVYFIAGSINCTKDPESVLEDAIEGGITIFQFREKGSGCLAGNERVQLACRLQAICSENGIPFIVNDDIDLALSLDADGVHVGQEDLVADEVRKNIGGKILGVSVHSEEEAKAAIAAGADYLGIGPVFATSTKEDAKPERGTELIEELRSKGYEIPIVGIGGINSGNAASVVRAGADGVSVITAISLAPDIKAEARELKKQVSIGLKTN